MKYLPILLIFILISCGEDNSITPTETVSLNVSMNHTFDGEQLETNKIYTNDAGNELSVSKLKYLLSNFNMTNNEGDIIELDSSYAFVDFGTGRVDFQLSNVEVGNYSSLTFNLGVDSLINSSDPNIFPQESPLNPIVNDMYWNWADGFIFMTLEGLIYEDSELKDAITYHVGLNKSNIIIEINDEFEIDESGKINLELDVSKIFKSETNINVDDYPYVTHSKTDFGLSDALARNIKKSFTLKK